MRQTSHMSINTRIGTNKEIIFYNAIKSLNNRLSNEVTDRLELRRNKHYKWLTSPFLQPSVLPYNMGKFASYNTHFTTSQKIS